MLPTWYPRDPMGCFAGLLIFGLVRASLVMSKQYLSIFANQAFISEQRQLFLRDSLIKKHDFSNQEIIASFSEVIAQAGNHVINLSQCINAFTSVTLFAGLSFWMAPKEALLGFVLLSACLLPIKNFAKRVSRFGDRILYDWQLVNKILLSGLKNIFFLRLHRMLGEEVRRGQIAIRSYEENYRQYAIASSVVAGLPQLAGMLVLCAIALAGTLVWKTHPYTLLSFLYIFIRLAQTAGQLNSYYSYLRLTDAGFEELRTKFSSKFGASADSFSQQNSTSVKAGPVLVSARGLSGGYLNNPPLFRGLDFDIIPSKMLLIKGPSGVGKSTLLKILVGEMEPLSGQILCNGQQPQHYSELSARLGYVGPEPFMIYGSVRENLLYGNPRHDVSDEEIWKMLGQIGMQEIVEAFTNGLDQVLVEETQLSSGQKQRFAMVRALLRKPGLLILDEATANIDKDTENKIINYLGEIKKDITTFVISHKESFDSIADETIYLEKKH